MLVYRSGAGTLFSYVAKDANRYNMDPREVIKKTIQILKKVLSKIILANMHIFLCQDNLFFFVLFKYLVVDHQLLIFWESLNKCWVWYQHCDRLSWCQTAVCPLRRLSL